VSQTSEQVSTDRLRGNLPSATITDAPWVAGHVATRLPNTGSASFEGIMQGQAQKGSGPIRNVQGPYGMSYNWAQSSGHMYANFDHKNYSGSVFGSGANFGASFTSGNRVGAFSGNFNTGPGANGTVVGQSGLFGIVGPNYLASGVFGGGLAKPAGAQR
jgi:hypothetical protein